MASTDKTGPKERRLRLCRPRSLEDYRKLEENSREWDSGFEFFFTQDWFAQSTDYLPGRHPRTDYWKSTWGKDDRINPYSTNWCNFLLINSNGDIMGRFFSVGVSETYVRRHLNPDLEEALFPIEWRDLYVPNPAQPETGRYLITELLVNWADPIRAFPLMRATDYGADLFQIEKSFSQTFGNERDDSGSIAAQKYGLRLIRTHYRDYPFSFDPEGGRVLQKVWVWERTAGILDPYAQAMSNLEIPPPAIPPIARFYQSLSLAERQVLNLILSGCERKAIADRMCLSVKRIDQLISATKEKFMESEEAFQQARLTYEVNASSSLHALLIPFAEVLKRIAWFYGEGEEMTFPDEPHES